MKLLIEIIIFVVLVCWLAELKITFKPFHISVLNWRSALGILIIVIGIGVYYNSAYRKGWNNAIDKVIDVIDSYKNGKK